jgi:dTDP-4-dehydrorhamnose reductase
VVDDQRGAPTSSRLIAATTAAMLSQWSAGDPARRSEYNGTYHLAAAGETSWCGFARAIVACAAAAGLIPRETPVDAIGSADFPTRARRPAYSVLDTTKLRRRFGLFLPPWMQGLEATIGELAEAQAVKFK